MRLLISEAEGMEPFIVDEALLRTMEQAAETALRAEGLDPDWIEISLSFVSPEEIRELNREHRGVDRVTDVLSFPLVEDLNGLMWLEDEDPEEEDYEDTEDDLEDSVEGEAWAAPLGDVVICLAQAEAQAKEYGHSREREIVYLFVHSVLHLLGYDHMEEDEKHIMRTREEEIMRAVELPR